MNLFEIDFTNLELRVLAHHHKVEPPRTQVPHALAFHYVNLPLGGKVKRVPCGKPRYVACKKTAIAHILDNWSMYA